MKEYLPILQKITWCLFFMFQLTVGQLRDDYDVVHVMERSHGYSLRVIYNGSSPEGNSSETKENRTEPQSEFELYTFRWKISSPDGDGIMAVVNTLDLNNTIPVTNDSCHSHNYLQLAEVGKIESAPLICGIIAANDISFKPIGLVGSRSYFSPYKAIEAKLTTHGKRVNLDMVFTAFYDCSVVKAAFNKSKRVKCSSTHDYSCMSKDFVCDSSIDCGFEDDFGWDESGCLLYRFGYGRILGIGMGFVATTYLIYGVIRWLRVK